MKKYILFLFVLFLYTQVFSQELYLIFDESTPIVTRDVRKHLGLRGITEPQMAGCYQSKSFDEYYYRYFWIYGSPLKLKPKKDAVPQIIQRSQISTLYPNAKTWQQLDQDIQPDIEWDYENPRKFGRGRKDIRTIKFFLNFQKIYVIEYLPNNQAKVIQVKITTTFE